MQRPAVDRALRVMYQLELYEFAGIIVSSIAVVVFFAYAKRLDDIIGVNGFHWRVVNNVIGMYQNLLPWVFTGVLTVLFALFQCLKRQSHQWSNKLAYLVRVLIAFCIMLAIYKIVNFYTSVFNPFDRDIVLQKIDRALFFGKLPSEWLSYISCKPLTYVCSFAYMSWFPLTYGTILLMWSHSRKAMAEFAFTAIATFYVGYITYLLVPAIGPIFTVDFTSPVGGITGMFTQDQALVSRDCFPSLHTGISIVMLVHVWRYRRKWLWLYGPLVTLIVFSTMYLRFHYGIDVIAGFSLAVAMTQISPLLVAMWERKRNAYLVPPEPVSHASTQTTSRVTELA